MKLLLPLAWLFACISRLRFLLYLKGFRERKRLPGFVISVGNIEVGGTGKSPVVMAICQRLREQGFRPAILTRGYRSGLKANDSMVLLGSSILQQARAPITSRPDEACMQAERLQNVPVIVGQRRYEAALRYLKDFPAPTHWILDDGFQHMQLYRDYDIVLLDGQHPFSNGYCLPVGRLREPPQALQRADHIIVTRDEAQLDIESLLTKHGLRGLDISRVSFVDGSPRQLSGPLKDLASIQSWGLVLGVARPERIRKSLSTRGLIVSQEYCVGDHMQLQTDKLHTLAQSCEALVTTEKDYWRDPTLFANLGCPVFILPLELIWKPSSALSDLFRKFTRTNID